MICDEGSALLRLFKQIYIDTLVSDQVDQVFESDESESENLFNININKIDSDINKILLKSLSLIQMMRG